VSQEGDRARTLLAYANYAKVAEALLVSRASVAGWAKGRNVTPYRLRQLEQLLRPDLQIEEAAPPTWVERLLAGTMALEEHDTVSDEDLARAQAKAAAYLAVARQRRLPPEGGGDGSASAA
jgi:transcriptional regulator with XRE-family HTH domain